MKRILLLAMVLFAALPLVAQQTTAAAPTSVSDIIEQFHRAAGLNWLTIAEEAGTRLFGWLSLLELALACGMLMLEQSDVAGWTAAFTRRFLVIGGLYALLTMGPGLASDVIDSYIQIGQRASGITGGISASNILADGINIASTLLITANQQAAEIHFLTALALAFATVAIVYSFLKLVRAFVIARIESYITISAAAIQLAWGGSRFTSTYAERYVGGAIANAVRILAVYLVLGIERYLAPSWIQQTADLGNDGYTSGFARLLLLVVSIVLFCSLVDIEKWAGVIFGGQPQFSHHDVSNAYMPLVTAGASVLAAGASTYLTLQSAGMFSAVSGMAAAAAGGAGGGGAAGGAGGGVSYAGMRYIAELPSGGGSTRASYLLPPAPPQRPQQRYLPPPGA